MTTLLFWMQILGGLFYLLNKIFFCAKERSSGDEQARLWSIRAWAVYILGLVPWLIILGHKDDWMIVFVEAGGLPSMLLGLVLALKHDKMKRRTEVTLDWFARICAVLGIGYSVYHFGLMTNLTQWYELGGVIGFLVGTYRLAKNHLDGYAWFALMNASVGLLMYTQGYAVLGIQQLLSLVFVIDAYIIKAQKEQKTE